MCGIAGKVSSVGNAPAELVERMCAAQEHRGPDSRGLYVAPGVALGIQRLRVIDVEHGDQPIYSEDGSVAVVLNGEIYNFRELRDELKARGHTFTTDGDTEVIVHLYEELGPGLVERLNGMFAFALWDEQRKRLVVARDRVGKKPLFYCLTENGMSFASELAALVEDPSVPRQIDPSSLDCYLAYGYIQAPYSIWRDVRKLPPGHTLVWEDGKADVSRYWALDYSSKTDAELPELEGELRALVHASVERRMVADVPLGAFLSGGVDSAIVVSEMAFLSSQPVRTFSIGFEDERFNELGNARLIAERFGTDHQEFTVKPDAVDLLPKLVRHYGEPFADSSAIPSFYLAEMTRRHVTVALNGDGGDESFAGYRRHVADALGTHLDRIPRGIRKALSGAASTISSGERSGYRGYASRFFDGMEEDAQTRYAEHVGIFGSAARSALLAPAIREQVDPARAEAVIGDPWRSAGSVAPLDRILAVDVASYLPGDLLPKIDIASMAYSLEARSPLLDPSLMQFAASLPPRYKARLGGKKWILRRAYRDRLPDQILNGPKRGFGVPLGSWLRGDLRDWSREILLDASTLDRGLLEPASVRSLLDAHDSGSADRSHQIWALLCLEMWQRELG